MSKIVISGYYGFANAGDEAMLTAIIKALRSTENSVGLTVISGNPQVTAARYKVNSIHRFNPWEILTALRSCDLLLSGGGSLLQDVTSKRSLLYYLSILALGLLLGKRVMLFAQGIGPIHSRLLRKLTQAVCSRVDLITVRDQDSLYELRRIGIPAEKVQLTADAVLTLPPEGPEQGKRLLQEFKVPQDKMLLAISVRKWQDDDRYLLELAKAADSLSEEFGAHVVLLPLQYPVDVEACTRLQHFMVHKDNSTVLTADCDTEQFLSLMGNFDLLIGMRLHALIFAAVMELPFAAVSYDPKIDGFVKDINGLTAGRVESLQAAQVVAAAKQALSRGYCGDTLQKLRAKAMLNAKQALALLTKGD
ncbi:MAG: polysaccharide pyruvyl transferase CsaB [Phascolarctobacterium sp.]|uniref:polysaccharide pyruvyl transferase CsaB n=1 Tax=Phascolarctobacterium sp. TaxID=2049039 RepID=UPI0026DAA747|nr:polysaccharide pyruvyl transferase CsaB [Phascolarctobacterium sp.]MDO4920482.1 polysaccharide pyruvyl transferase CsaB [Phascolarctobacterium sp.]